MIADLNEAAAPKIHAKMFSSKNDVKKLLDYLDTIKPSKSDKKLYNKWNLLKSAMAYTHDNWFGPFELERTDAAELKDNIKLLKKASKK